MMVITVEAPTVKGDKFFKSPFPKNENKEDSTRRFLMHLLLEV